MTGHALLVRPSVLELSKSFSLKPAIQEVVTTRVYFEELTKGQKISKKYRQDFIKDSAQLFAERLEHYTSQNPLQWFNFFEFWKKI